MKRRDFILTAAAASLVPGLAQAFVGRPYKPGLVERRLRRGDTVFMDFYTNWCSTCAAQARVINALTGGNPDYEKHITFIKVDWDQHKASKLSRRLQIPSRSTLVALKGDEELGRIVAGTSTAVIKELLDLALRASLS